MGITLVIVAAVAAVAAIAAIAATLTRRRRRGSTPATPGVPSGQSPHAPDLAPMTGLESALERVTDRSGRPIRERIDAEASHVDDLRVPDDTGPLLRRALDHVARPGPDAAVDPSPEAAAVGDDEAERDA